MRTWGILWDAYLKIETLSLSLLILAVAQFLPVEVVLVKVSPAKCWSKFHHFFLISLNWHRATEYQSARMLAITPLSCCFRALGRAVSVPGSHS